MNMLYKIQMIAPLDEGRGCPIQVDLWPEWKEAVARSAITQQGVNHAVKMMHRTWLDGCGWSRMFDPDNCGFDRDKDKPLGPNAYKAYGEHAIRVSWGEWGPEHITVPGDACGLDLSHSIGGAPSGMSLTPHNMDTMAQAWLCLVIFTFFAEGIVSEEIVREYNGKRGVTVTP
jgi:hypothetical protein